MIINSKRIINSKSKSIYILWRAEFFVGFLIMWPRNEEETDVGGWPMPVIPPVTKQEITTTLKSAWYIGKLSQGLHKETVLVWMRNVSHRFLYLNTWSPGVQVPTVWDRFGTFRGWSLAGGSMSVGWALRVHSLILLPVCSLCLLFLVSALPVATIPHHHCGLSFSSYKPK